MRKRLLACVLALAMATTLLPMSVFAAGPLKVVEPAVTQDTYTFDGDNDNAQKVASGGKVYVPATPKKAGEHFTGWKEESSGATISAGEQYITADTANNVTHAYASQWEKAYYVYFMASDDANETEVVASARVEPNGTVTPPENYKPENGQVTKWVIKGTDTEFTKTTEVTADTVVVPVIEEGCWVTFNTLGGTEVTAKFVTVNSTIDLSSVNSTRVGYTFKGWSEAPNGNVVSNSYEVTGNKTLYAVWEGATVDYTVVYWGENADDTDYSLLQTDPDTKQAKAGAQVSSTSVAKSFPYFTYDASKVETITVKADGSSVLNVYYSRNVYTMTFKGVTTGDCQLVEHRHSHDQCCTKRGYHWWCNTNKCPVGYEHSHRDDTAGDLVIKAKYDSNISYVWENAPISSLIGQNKVFLTSISDYENGTVFIQKMLGQDITLKPKTWTNNSLKTWSYYLEVLPGQDTSGLTTKTDKGKTYYLYHSASAHCAELTYDEDYVNITGFTQRDSNVPNFGWDGKADLFYLRDSYTLILKNGDAAAQSERFLYQADISGKGADPQNRPSGYSDQAEFQGWYAVSPEKITATTEPYDFNEATMPAKNLILFAYWKEPDVKLTIKVGDETKVDDKVPFGSVLADTNLFKSITDEPEGFLYWAYEDGTPIATDIQLKKDTVIKAVCEGDIQPAQTYQVTYVDNSANEDTYRYRTGTVAEAKDYTGSTSGFLYWKDEQDNYYYPGASVSITGNVKLTPVFVASPETPETTSLTYHANYEVPEGTTDTYVVNNLATGTNHQVLDYDATELPIRTGYTFTGWNTNAAGTETAYAAGASFSLTKEDSNDLYAQWTINKYTLTVTKTFTGIDADQIPTDFAISLKGENDAVYELKLTPPGTDDAFIGPDSGATTSENGITYTWTINQVPYGTYTVSESSADVSNYELKATYVYDDQGLVQNDNSYSFAFAKASTLAVTNSYKSSEIPPTPDTLTVEKKVIKIDGADYNANNNSVAYLGDQIVWTITVTNTGDKAAKTTLTESLPAGSYTVYTDAILTSKVTVGEDGTWTATVPAKTEDAAGTVTYYVVATVNQQNIIDGQIKNVVTMGDEEKEVIIPTKWNIDPSKVATNLTKNTNGKYESTITLTVPNAWVEHEGAIANSAESNTPQVIYDEIMVGGRDGYLSFVLDKIGYGKDNYGNDYDFSFVNDPAKLTLLYNGEELKAKEMEKQASNDWTSGYLFTDKSDQWVAQLHYFANDPNDGECIKLFILKYPVSSDSKGIALKYAVELQNAKTSSGTYGVYDRDGSKQTENSSLYTNLSAILYRKKDNTEPTSIYEYLKPTVSYTVSNSSGGGGGHSRPTLNTEDHYGYIIGYPDGTVQPGGSITRAEVATIFFRMLTDSSRTEFWSQTNSFSDVPSTAWFNNAVSTLTKAGIIAGYEDGTFQPNATITRAEFATIAVRFFDATYDGKDYFTDIDGHWAQQYINDAANAGLVNGYEDGTFGPNKAITRAEAMALVNRALDRHPDADHFLKDMVTWPDNSDTKAWYYEDVQEATNSHEYTMKTNTDKTKYENWTKMLKMRDWKAFEAAWSDANSASNPGEVMGK